MGGAVRDGQPITRAALQRSCCAVRGDCARGHGEACGAAEHSGLGFLQWKNAHFSMFLHVFGRCHAALKMKQSGTPPPFSLFFGRTQKRCYLAPKMVKRDTGPFFCRFCSTLKAVLLNTKNGAEGHRPFFVILWRIQKRCHAASKMKQSGAGPQSSTETRAGERYQLVGHQMNEQVRYCAVQALEGEPGKVAQAGANTTQRHLGLGGKAGMNPRELRGSGSAPRSLHGL